MSTERDNEIVFILDDAWESPYEQREAERRAAAEQDAKEPDEPKTP